MSQTGDKLLDCCNRASTPQLGKLGCGHAGHIGKLLQAVTALCGGALDGGKRLRHCRAACLGFNTDRAHRRGKRHDLAFAQSGKRTCRGKPRRHRHDVSLCGGEVVAERNDRRAEPSVVLGGGAGDVGKLSKGACGFIGGQIGTVAKVDHRSRKRQHIIGRNTELTCRFRNGRYLGRSGRNFRCHLSDAVRNRGKLCVCAVNRFEHTSDSAFKLDRCRNAAFQPLSNRPQTSGNTCRSQRRCQRVNGIRCTLGLVAKLVNTVRGIAVAVLRLVQILLVALHFGAEVIEVALGIVELPLPLADTACRSLFLCLGGFQRSAQFRYLVLELFLLLCRITGAVFQPVKLLLCGGQSCAIFLRRGSVTLLGALGVRQCMLQRFDLVFLCLQCLTERLILGFQRIYAACIVLIFSRYKFHFRIKHFKGAVNFLAGCFILCLSVKT